MINGTFKFIWDMGGLLMRTLLKAIKNNQQTTWPGLTAKAVEKYLPDNAPATDKGYMSRHRKGI